MSNSVKYELDVNKKKIVVLFKNGPDIEDPDSFCKTHYFMDANNTMITTIFKDELLRLFGVPGVMELKAKVDNNIRLVFKPGDGVMMYDEGSKTVVVYTGTFKREVVTPNNRSKRLKKSIEKVSQKKDVSSHEFANLVTAIADGSEHVGLDERDKKAIARAIPKLIKNGDIKISLKDITDINKDRLKDIVQLGRDLLAKKRGVEKQLGIDREHIGKEYAWQKYFEMYGSYLLFGSIEEKLPEEWIKVESEFRNKSSRLDLLTINRYGFLDIVELKRSDEFLFKLDTSHDNVVPTDKLSTAISQVNNYLMMLPYDLKNGRLVKGAESATGMLVIGSKETLMKKVEIERYAKKSGNTIEQIERKLRKALRDLNYSYAHIQIVLYDELLNNLDKFINQMEIKMQK